MTEKFIDALLNLINEVFETYYEEAPKNIKFPYGVIPTITISSLNKGYQCFFDIEIYINELSDTSVETICDNLRNHLDEKSYLDEEIGFHIGFDNQYLIKQNEQDLIFRRISFVARIFY